ncbi:MAG TPA: YfcE family phosphodiesterase [bacterium]|nr:YfcE family phosphodiesterase [bacterium]
MKVAIISDLHDNLATLDIFFKMIATEDINKIICCGDVTNSETLKKLATTFNQEIYLIKGNAEIYLESDLKKYKNINYLNRFGICQLGNFKAGLCHEPAFIKDILNQEKNIDFIFYGHTHKPWQSMKNKAILINPGTLGGVFQKPSFAIWDDISGKIKLKLIH